MQLTPADISEFRETVWSYYSQHGRTMPWRTSPTPYRVLVSELMLQQTQVTRVIPKFEAFMEQFPDLNALARASLASVLQSWSGLGYNRRAKFLHQTAQQVRASAGGLPQSLPELIALPGIGPNTAGAIMAYAYDQPVVFIETNIRTVYFHYFFSHTPEMVDDKQLRSLVEQTIDTERPRHWYWALMDYGTHLKKTAGSRITQSRHYKKQAQLEGSLRQMRGWILQKLSQAPMSNFQLESAWEGDSRLGPALAALASEGMIEHDHQGWRLTGYQEAS